MSAGGDPHRGLRLYVARSTPNSERAEQNLKLALADLGDRACGLRLEVVDVFAEPRRAINDGVIVTPTLIGLRDEARLVMIGDLTDLPKLHGLLTEMTVGLDHAAPPRMRSVAGGMAS